jgi:hypothetical protein
MADPTGARRYTERHAGQGVLRQNDETRQSVTPPGELAARPRRRPRNLAVTAAESGPDEKAAGAAATPSWLIYGQKHPCTPESLLFRQSDLAEAAPMH